MRPACPLRGSFDGAQGRIILGIRPEDVTIAAPGEGAIEGQVYASELTGEAVLVTVSVGGARLIARAPRSFRGSFGMAVGLRADGSRLHLFDEATGQRIEITDQRKAA
jgi:multiple sugar transport system ATP-binding protein